MGLGGLGFHLPAVGFARPPAFLLPERELQRSQFTKGVRFRRVAETSDRTKASKQNNSAALEAVSGFENMKTIS